MKDRLTVRLAGLGLQPEAVVSGNATVVFSECEGRRHYVFTEEALARFLAMLDVALAQEKEPQ
jgi:hypothetical protein